MNSQSTSQDQLITRPQDPLSQAIRAIDAANSRFTYDVWVPSLGVMVPFKEISTAQQKALLKSIVDSEIYNTGFILSTYDILKSNCTDSSIDIASLTIIDKLFILLHMRAVSISDTLDIQVKSKVDPDVVIKRSINLMKLIEKGKNAVSNIEEECHTVDNYTITYNVPSIEVEYQLERQLRNDNIDIEINDINELRSNIGTKFIGEVSKYIKRVDIAQEDGNSVTIDLSQYSFKDRIQLIERLPSRCLDLVFKYIKRVDDQIDQLSLYKGSFTHKDKTKEQFEYTINLDSRFFIAS